MKLLGTIVAGLLAFAATLFLIEAIAPVDHGVLLDWLPWSASVLAVVAFGLRGKSRIGFNVAGTGLCVLLVLALDLAGAVLYSCSKGVCL